MTAEDMQELERIAPALLQFKNIGVFSPWKEAEGRLFPGLKALPRWRWDLNNQSKKRFDVLVACNVFMMSPDPAKWFRHALAACRYFLMIDPVRRRRTADSELGKDGDQTRFTIGKEKARVEHAFDLASLGNRLLAYRTYFGGANEHDSDPLHVIALFRGDLAEPILRVDDYPTGIRPILPDLSQIHRIVDKLESRELSYRLGIVPALLDDGMMSFLRRLRHMIPCVHGYDHSYPKYAPVLQQKGDPYNERTVGTFNEFARQAYGDVLSKLQRGKMILEEGLGRSVETYIPPCNRGDRKTGRALSEAGYRYYMSEKRIPGCRLPRFRSDFYGRSNEYDLSANPDVITLHATWEWDVQRNGDSASLDRLLDHLEQRTKSARELNVRIAAPLSAG